MKSVFVDLVLPRPLPGSYTYEVPEALVPMAARLRRAVVPFGAKDKIITGVIVKVHTERPGYKTKFLHDIPETFAWFTELQWSFYEWMATYYMAKTGEVLNAGMPAGLKLSSETRISYNPEYDFYGSGSLEDDEAAAIDFIKKHDSAGYPDLAAHPEVKNVYSVVKRLCAKKAIVLYEEVKHRYKPKLIKMVRLGDGYVFSEVLETLFEELEKKPKQAELLLKFLRQVPVINKPELNTAGMEKNALLEGDASASAYATLLKKGLFEEFEKRINRIVPEKINLEAPQLSPAQTAALSHILDLFLTKNTVLLHGITGSGKTAIYIQLIQRALQEERQILFMLPEIALTAQITQRLGAVFGDKMAIYHSKYSDNERLEVWEGVVTGKFSIVVGVRSSVLLPFSDLGLVIIDEEHEPSYKQQDPAPRYHARDAALKLAQLHGAKTLMGSATPSIEMYHLARQEKFGLVELNERYGGVQMPEIIFSDLRKETKRKTMKGPFSSLLLDKLDATVAEGKQAIFFQNRRGYAPFIQCEDCGMVPECEECTVSLTYHLHRNELRCHHSGFKMKKPDTCPACGSYNLRPIGVGTEKLEDDLRALRDKVRIVRMDSDTTSSKFSYSNIIASVESGRVDVLVGTQMVTKGLDFENVHLVGIFDIDRILHFPDFRSGERVFQLICQVSGRAGRRSRRGEVIIQTMQPENPILQLAVTGDYKKFYEREVAERQKYAYPPFTRLIKITVKHRDKDVAFAYAQKTCNFLTANTSVYSVLGPEAPAIYKIRNEFIFEILLKLPRYAAESGTLKTSLLHFSQKLNNENTFKNIRLSIDMDVMF